MTKEAESGSRVRIRIHYQRHGPADPDPHQNAMDPQHCFVFRWYLFRSWGRVGTTIGGTKLEDFEDKHEALRSFEFLYEEKTGNKWKNRKDFKKVQ
jgi:predicted DNA-binding WGR domain protein